jgi:hypothetical protein
MNTSRREAELAKLQWRQRDLRRELARVERQIVQAERRVHATEKRLYSLAKSSRQAA